MFKARPKLSDFRKYLLPEEELNIHLVIEGMKPATEIVFAREEPVGSETFLKIDSRDEAKFEGFLKNSNLFFLRNKKAIESSRYRPELRREFASYLIGKERENVFKLANARTGEQFGHAYGFPERAIKYFLKKKGGRLVHGSDMNVEMEKARLSGIKIPIWLAYISHIPEEYDFLNNKLSKSSMRQGEKFRAFMRKSNPSLAKRVEHAFMNRIKRELPIRWKLKRSGSYEQLEYRRPSKV
jgi:hypothetical protein